MDGAIGVVHWTCFRAFNALVGAIDSPARDFSQDITATDVEVQYDRYQLWSGNLGAGHAGAKYQLSLDYRLRESEFMRTQVLFILKTLVRRIEDATALLLAQRTPWEEKSSELGEESTTSSKNGDDIDGSVRSDEDDGEDSPWDVSSSDEEDNRSSNSRGSESNEDVGPAPLKNTSLKAPTTLENTDSSSGEMSQLLDSIKHTIDCLYKLPIRKASPSDKYSGGLPKEIQPFEYFDVLYVKDKFPHFRDKNPEVATRLGKLITRRRRLLYQRKQHHDALQTQKIAAEAVRIAPIRPVINLNQTNLTPSVVHSAKSANTEEKPQTLLTKATTFKMEKSSLFQSQLDAAALLGAPSVAPSAPSAPPSTYASQNLPLQIPPRPKGADGKELKNFLCPYCFVVVNIANQRQWRQHVFQDLSPYACTYQDCELGEYFFQSRQEWFAHETTHHRLQWWCNVDHHLEYHSKAQFETHMVQEHSKDISKHDPASIRDLFGKPTQSTGGVCVLCENETASLETHVGRHLEQLALFCIPRAHYLDDDDKIGPGDQSDDSRQQIGRALSQDTDLSDLTFSDGEEQLETERAEHLGKRYLTQDELEELSDSSKEPSLDLRPTINDTEPYPLEWGAAGYQISFNIPNQHSGTLMYLIELSNQDETMKYRFLYRGGDLVELKSSDDPVGWLTSIAPYVMTQVSYLTHPGDIATHITEYQSSLKDIKGWGPFETAKTLASDNLRAGKERHIHMASMVSEDHHSRKLPPGHIGTCCYLTRLLFDSTTLFEESENERVSKQDLPKCAVLLKTSLFWGILALQRYFSWDYFSTFIFSDKLNHFFKRPPASRDELIKEKSIKCSLTIPTWTRPDESSWGGHIWIEGDKINHCRAVWPGGGLMDDEINLSGVDECYGPSSTKPEVELLRGSVNPAERSIDYVVDLYRQAQLLRDADVETRFSLALKYVQRPQRPKTPDLYITSDSGEESGMRQAYPWAPEPPSMEQPGPEDPEEYHLAYQKRRVMYIRAYDARATQAYLSMLPNFDVYHLLDRLDRLEELLSKEQEQVDKMRNEQNIRHEQKIRHTEWTRPRKDVAVDALVKGDIEQIRSAINNIEGRLGERCSKLSRNPSQDDDCDSDDATTRLNHMLSLLKWESTRLENFTDISRRLWIDNPLYTRGPREDAFKKYVSDRVTLGESVLYFIDRLDGLDLDENQPLPGFIIAELYDDEGSVRRSEKALQSLFTLKRLYTEAEVDYIISEDARFKAWEEAVKKRKRRWDADEGHTSQAGKEESEHQRDEISDTVLQRSASPVGNISDPERQKTRSEEQPLSISIQDIIVKVGDRSVPRRPPSPGVRFTERTIGSGSSIVREGYGFETRNFAEGTNNDQREVNDATRGRVTSVEEEWERYMNWSASNTSHGHTVLDEPEEPVLRRDSVTEIAEGQLDIRAQENPQTQEEEEGAFTQAKPIMLYQAAHSQTRTAETGEPKLIDTNQTPVLSNWDDGSHKDTQGEVSVATVEDYDNEAQKVVPTSRIQALRERQSSRKSITRSKQELREKSGLKDVEKSTRYQNIISLPGTSQISRTPSPVDQNFRLMLSSSSQKKSPWDVKDHSPSSKMGTDLGDDSEGETAELDEFYRYQRNFAMLMDEDDAGAEGNDEN